MNPFTYTKNPQTIVEAQSNLNYWWFEGMECPADTIPANWNTFIREMKREANRVMQKVVDTETESV